MTPQTSPTTQPGPPPSTPTISPPPDTLDHVHVWEVNAPDGETSAAVCSGCGALRTFANSAAGATRAGAREFNERLYAVEERSLPRETHAPPPPTAPPLVRPRICAFDDCAAVFIPHNGTLYCPDHRKGGPLRYLVRRRIARESARRRRAAGRRT